MGPALIKSGGAGALSDESHGRGRGVEETSDSRSAQRALAGSSDSQSALAGESHGRGQGVEETFATSDSRRELAGGSHGRGRGVEETFASSDSRSALGALAESRGAGAMPGSGSVEDVNDTSGPSDSLGAGGVDYCKDSAGNARFGCAIWSSSKAVLGGVDYGLGRDSHEGSDFADARSSDEKGLHREGLQRDSDGKSSDDDGLGHRRGKGRQVGEQVGAGVMVPGRRGVRIRNKGIDVDKSIKGSNDSDFVRTHRVGTGARRKSDGKASQGDFTEAKKKIGEKDRLYDSSFDGKNSQSDVKDGLDNVADVIDGGNRKRDRESDLEDGRFTENKLDRVSMHDKVGSDSYESLGRNNSDDMKDYVGHSLLMHMYKIDDKNYENCLIGDYKDLKETRKGKRALEQTDDEVKLESKEYYSPKNFDTIKIKSTDNTENASNSGKLKSMVKCTLDVKDKNRILEENKNANLTDSSYKKSYSMSQFKRKIDAKKHYYLKYGKRREYIDVIEEENSRDIYPKRGDKDVDRENNEDWDTVRGQCTYENGDRNNNLVDQGDDENKLRARANWIARNTQVIDKSDVVERQDTRHMDTKTETASIVGGNASSSGVEGSSERSEGSSDESSTNISEKIANLETRVFPTKTKLYEILSKRSGMSDSFSERESEIHAGTDTSEGGRPHARAKEKKKVLVKLLPIKQDSNTSDSGSGDEIMPASDMSDRKVRRMKKERRSSDLVEEKMGEFADSSSEGGLTSSDSAKGNMSDPEISNRRKKVVTDTTLSDDKSLLSKSEDMLNASEVNKKIASLKNVTPLRQPSYKIAVRNGEHSEQLREIYPESNPTISDTGNKKTPKKNESEIKQKQFEPSKKPFLRKVSYEKAVRGGEISITPSPTSKNPFRTNFVPIMTLPHHLRPSYDTNARKTKSMELLDQSNVVLEGYKTVSLTEVPRTISADTLKQSKLRLMKSTSESTMIKFNTSEQQLDISDSSNTTSNTLTGSTKTTPIRYSNFEKLLPLGGILSLIKGKPCSGTSESQGSVVSLSSDSKSAQIPSTAQSCDNVSNLSGRSNSSTPVEELIHVIKDDASALDTIVVYTWNAKCESTDNDSKSDSMKSVRQSPVIVEDNEACGSQEEITSKKQQLPSKQIKTEATDTMVATTHPYDNMMKIMLTNEIPDINKIIIRKLKSSHAKASSNSARRFLIDGEVILLEDDLSICKNCNIPPVEILWARQIIARLDDQRVYANIPPYAENLTVIRRILAKTNTDLEEELAATGKAFRPNVDITRGLKIKFVKRKSPRKNVHKFIKGAIEVIPEVSDEEYSADDNKYSQKINATSLRGKGCQRRNLTRKARAYDQKQMKKFTMKLDDTSSSEKQNLLSNETVIDPAKSKKLLGYMWNNYKKGPRSGFKSSLKVKQLDERISKAFKTYEEKRPSVLTAPYRLGLQCEAAKMTDSIEDKEDWKAENPLENYSVRFSKKMSDEIPRRKESDLKLWWKMLKSLKKSKNTNTNKPRTRFPAVPLSMNLIPHEKGRLEIMYGDKDVYPFTVGEYSIEDGRYLTLEEFFLKQYYYYQPPEDYFFNVNGRNTNLTSIQMNRKLNIFRQSGSKIRHFNPIYVFKPTNNPGVCPKKRNSTSKQILRQFFTRGEESSTVDKGYLEKPMPKRRISMPYLPPRRVQKMTVQFSEIPPKVGPKPKKYRTVRTDENDAHIDHTKDTRTPELPSNVKHLKPGMYFYPYSDDDSKPKYFLKITISESKPPVVSFHCVEGHPVLEHLIEKRLSLNDGDLEKWDPVIFKINPNEVNVQTYDLRMCPPCLLSEELVNNDDEAISYVNESNAVQETHFSTFEDTSNDSQRRCLHRTDEPITGLYEGKFPLLRDSITHKLVERTQLDRHHHHHHDDEKYQQETRTQASKCRSPSFKGTFEEKVMSPKPEDFSRKSAASETEVQSRKHENTSSSHIEISDTIHRVSPQSGAKYVIKPYISAITALEPDHQTRLCQSYPSTNVPSPTQLSNPEADTHSLHEQTSDSMQQTSQDPKPCSCELQCTEQSRILPVAAPRHSLAETLPDWYLPRHPRSNMAQKSLDIETDARPVYANVSIFKGGRSLSESQKYPWDSQNQGLTIPCKPTVQRRLSTGETDLPHYENVFFPETCQQNTEDSFVTDIQHRLLHISDIQQRYPVPISPTQERQQQLSPSYYSLSHYPLTDDGYPVCSTLRHVDGSYSEKIIHMPASRHSMSSAARHFVRSQNVPETYSGLYLKHCPWSPMKSQHTDVPERRYSREYVLTDSDFSLGRVSSSSGPSTDPILYPCMARHSIGTVSERVQLRRMQEILRLSSTIRNIGLQGKYRSRSSEFLDEMWDRRLDTGKKMRYRKKSDDAKHVSRSNEDIAERIAHHYLVDNASNAVISKEQMKRMKKHKDRYLKKHSGRICHSNEDIANRIAYHYVTEFKGEDGSLMSSRTTVSSPFHGRRSPVTFAFPDFPLDTQERPRSTPFSWCYGGTLPETVGPIIKESPIWGKVRKGRTRTV